MTRLLMIDDDLRLARAVQSYFALCDLTVDWAPTLSLGKQSLARHGCSALVLDLMLPDGDGMELIQEMREGSSDGIPVLVLSSRRDASDRVIGLERGADDYLGKPFEMRELLARMKALLRRAHKNGGGQIIHIDGLEVDVLAREVRLNGQRLVMTSYQFDLLSLLARNAGRVVSRDEIMDALRGHPWGPLDRSLDVHICKMRALIEADPRQPRRIVTVRGVGYVMARHMRS